MRYDNLSKDFGESVRRMVEEYLKENPDADLKELFAPLLRAQQRDAQYENEAQTLRTSAELWFQHHPDVGIEEFLETASLGSLINAWGRDTGVDARTLLRNLGTADKRPTDQ